MNHVQPGMSKKIPAFSLCDIYFSAPMGRHFGSGRSNNIEWLWFSLDSFVNYLGQILTFVKLSGFTDLFF